MTDANPSLTWLDEPEPRRARFQAQHYRIQPVKRRHAEFPRAFPRRGRSDPPRTFKDFFQVYWVEGLRVVFEHEDRQVVEAEYRRLVGDGSGPPNP